MSEDDILLFHIEGSFPERAADHISVDNGETLLCKRSIAGMVLEMGITELELGAAWDMFGGAVYLRPICRHCLKRYDKESNV